MQLVIFSAQMIHLLSEFFTKLTDTESPKSVMDMVEDMQVWQPVALVQTEQLEIQEPHKATLFSKNPELHRHFLVDNVLLFVESQDKHASLVLFRLHVVQL